MKRGYLVNMADRNNNGTLMVPPCGTMDGDKIRPNVQYGWSGWLMNMPIHINGDSRGGTKIRVTSRKWPKKS